MEINFMEPAQRGAVAQFDFKMFFEITVKLDASPMNLASLAGIFQHGHKQIAHPLQLDFAGAARPGLGDERVDAAAVEHLNPQTHPAIGTTKLFADCAAFNAQHQ